MKVFKFGGASVKNAEGVKNVLSVLKTSEEKDLIVVVSAMGKMTNLLEELVVNYFSNPSEIKSTINKFYEFHLTIITELFNNNSHPIFNKLLKFNNELQLFVSHNKSNDYSFVYDQIVSFGELISTTIISEYLSECKFKNKFLDVRSVIKTNANYREAKVNWEETQKKIINSVSTTGVSITQGFIASEGSHNFTTTLGREGSDYTAAIFAYCLNAKSVTIWKDVPGVLNADPRYFENATLLHSLSYEEAIELSYYGASVIHPKTLQPLQRKEIPLFVKSFLNPKNNGTKVGKALELSPKVPCYILRDNKILISVSSLDFSYIVEENISHIFKLLHLHKMKVRSIQNSAISFSVCVENKYDHLEPLVLQLKAKYDVKVDLDVKLYTIRHYNAEAIDEIEKNKTVLMKQITPETVQIITKS